MGMCDKNEFFFYMLAFFSKHNITNMLATATTLLKTDKSALVEHDLDADWCALVAQCVAAVDPLLDPYPKITLFGRECIQHRHIGFFAAADDDNGFHYSTSNTPSKLMPPVVGELLARVNARLFGGTAAAPFDGVFVNKYANGLDYIGKHSDDERVFDGRNGVAAISYGAHRKFRVRRKNKAVLKDNRLDMDVALRPDKMIQMAGAFQREFTHEIPIETKVTEPRWSFTFRKHAM